MSGIRPQANSDSLTGCAAKSTGVATSRNRIVAAGTVWRPPPRGYCGKLADNRRYALSLPSIGSLSACQIRRSAWRRVRRAALSCSVMVRFSSPSRPHRLACGGERRGEGQVQDMHSCQIAMNTYLEPPPASTAACAGFDDRKARQPYCGTLNGISPLLCSPSPETAVQRRE